MIGGSQRLRLVAKPCLVTLGCLAVLLLLPASAGAQTPPAPSLQSISQKRAEAIASLDPKVLAARRLHPGLSTVSERNDQGNWQVGFDSGDKEIVQVVIDSRTGFELESWTGYQVAWRMARGYPGAFGRTLNAPYVWLPLCLIFVLGLLDWRRPFRLAHLDLLVIVAGVGISHFFFNRGEIGLSAPLAYPALVYLLGRALWMGFRGGEGLRPSAPAKWLAIATLFLVGFRIGLNIADSNVIDVGYSGVVGADRIAAGKPIYGDFPSNDQQGDTYGPAAYYAYVPFEQVLPWSGNWDDLPAAHAAAIFFDLATIAGLVAFGRRLRRGAEGRRLGTILAFAWAACPYTTFALESNTNDALVSALLVGALLVLSSPIKRGAMLALASATKFAPLPLIPLFATFNASSSGWRGKGPHATRDAVARGMGFVAVTGPAGRTVLKFALGFLVVTGLVMLPTIIDPGISTFWHRTIGFQVGRESPFSLWGQTSLGPLHLIVDVLAGALAILVAFFPRRRDPVTVAALGAAVLIASQLTFDHWFYLYLPWFLPFLFIALAGTGTAPARSSRPALAG